MAWYYLGNMSTYKQFKGSDLKLDCGQELSEFDIAYHTYGQLNVDKSNVILICHPLTGDSNAKEWWPKIVGPGLSIDTKTGKLYGNFT